MSEKAYQELQRVRAEALEQQTKCAYCGKVCRNADHLYVDTAYASSNGGRSHATSRMLFWETRLY